MGDELVINSYKEQIKESALKADAVEKAGFDILIDFLNKHNVNTQDAVNYFNKIKVATTKEELDKLTIGELDTITENINKKVTEGLISPVEAADMLVRNGPVIAKQMSPTGKVSDNDNYVTIGNNLGEEVNKHGIAFGVNQAIRNYCTQKIYQILYEEKISEKEKETVPVTIPCTTPNVSSTKKDDFLKNILGVNPINNDTDFQSAKQGFMLHLTNTIKDLESYK